MDNHVIVIVGPTAIGKTKISIELAKQFNLEIISGDSVAVYKKLDIGSAKPSLIEQDGVKHHLIDILDPNEEYSVSHFQKAARSLIDEKKDIIICGGTGLYISSVLFDYEFEASRRDKSFEEQFSYMSNEELYNYLLSLDKNIDKEKIHMNNRKRVLRAIEILKDTNKSKEEFNNKNKLLYNSYIIYLNVNNRDVLYKRINDRVDMMIKDGLIDEVKGLYDMGICPHAIGYKEFIPYFLGKESLETVIEEIKKNTRHLAKRQMTWFKNQFKTHFYEVNLANINETILEITNDLKSFIKE